MSKFCILIILLGFCSIANAKCIRATADQRAQVNSGNQKIDRFLARCAAATKSSAWCQQLIRPNPASAAMFSCTYGKRQPHTLVHPNESTWTNAIKAVQIVESLTKQGIEVCQIYNWWRPEPYNKNVDGKPGRHPAGTSVDVRFCSNQDADRAFYKLCGWRAQGKINAIGHYGNSGLHLGIGDLRANTWGETCPNP
jgi:hypothetical protein